MKTKITYFMVKRKGSDLYLYDELLDPIRPEDIDQDMIIVYPANNYGLVYEQDRALKSDSKRTLMNQIDEYTMYSSRISSNDLEVITIHEHSIRI